MPVKADSKPKVAVGDDVIIEMNDEELKCTVSKIKSSGNIIVEDAEGSTYECEPHEVKPAKAAKKKAADEEEEEETPKKKKAAVEEEDDEPAPKKKKAAAEEDDEPAPKKKKAADDDDEPAAPKKKKLGWGSQAPAEQKNVGFPVGNWEALAFNGAPEAEKKKLSAFIEYVGVHDEEVKGKTQRVYYQLKDDKGNWLEGVGYFKRDLLLLGFSEEQLELTDEDDDEAVIADLTKLLKKLRKMETWVSLKAKHDKTREYINLFLNGPMDDQDDKPENPLSE